MTRFTAIDFETADYGRDSACAVALVVVVDGEILYSIDQLIRPPRPDFRFTHIHGLTWDHVAQSPTFGEIWPSLARMIEGSEFLVAHNAAFDKGVLNKCCAAAGLEPPEQRFACTVKAARRTWQLPSYKLNILADHLGIPLMHHDARSDAEACAKIAVEAMRLGTAL